MALRCTVCAHPERAAIDLALVGGSSERTIAGRYDLTRSSVQRHRSAHIKRAVARASRAASAREVQIGASILDRAEHVYADMRSRLEAIATGEDPKGAASVARSILTSLSLQAELRGELQRGGTVNVLVDQRGRPREEWARMLSTITAALQPYPEAAAAVARALRADGGEALAQLAPVTLEADSDAPSVPAL